MVLNKKEKPETTLWLANVIGIDYFPFLQTNVFILRLRQNRSGLLHKCKKIKIKYNRQNII